MKCGAFSVHTMKHCYATALYTTRAQAASGGEETAWAPLLTHAQHTHKNVHVNPNVSNVYECLYGGGAHASTVVPRPLLFNWKRPGNEARH